MARTIQDIQQEILQAKANEPALAELNSTSKTAIWRLWIYITAFAIHTLEKLFDQHRKEVSEALSELKPHTARWYRNKALAFRYGVDLLPDSDTYPPLPLEGDGGRIVKYSAVTESETESRLIVKIATSSPNPSEGGEQLQPITAQQKASFEAYMNEIKDAGVKITVISYPADRLRLGFKIVRNPLVLDEQGYNILTGTNPVQEAIENYLKNLPFNGELSLMKLIDAIQQVEGVEDLALLEASSSYFDGDDFTSYENIAIKTIAKSGYFKIENLNVEYVV